MASSQPEPLGHAGDDAAHVDGDEAAVQSHVQVEDSQYDQIGWHQEDGEQQNSEEAVGETQLGDKALGLVGSLPTVHHDLDPSSVLYDRSTDTATFVEGDEVNGRPLPEVNLLSRPRSAGASNPKSDFIFAKASRQQMDFVGNRKGPGHSVKLPGGEILQPETAIARSPEHTNVEGTISFAFRLPYEIY